MKLNQITKQKWFYPTLIILVACIAIASIILVVQKPAEQTPIESTPVNFTPKTQGVKQTAKQAWEKAGIEIAKWSSDYQIVEIFSTGSATGELALEGKPVGWNVEAYSATLGKTLSYFIGLDGELIRGAEIAKSIQSSQTFNLASWQVDSLQAYELAEANGGSALRAQDANTNLVYDLKKGENDDTPVWTLWYPNSNNPKLTVKIDATNGDLLY